MKKYKQILKEPIVNSCRISQPGRQRQTNRVYAEGKGSMRKHQWAMDTEKIG